MYYLVNGKKKHWKTLIAMACEVDSIYATNFMKTTSSACDVLRSFGYKIKEFCRTDNSGLTATASKKPTPKSAEADFG